MSDRIYWDADITWDISDTLSVTVGDNNIFNEFPGPTPDFSSCCGRLYDASTVMDWQGSYYFVRGVLRWT